MKIQKTKEIKGEKLTGTFVDEKTIVIEGIGKVTKIGELDLKAFIEDAMNMPSFWERQ